MELIKKPDFYHSVKLDIIIEDKKKAMKKARKDKPG